MIAIAVAALVSNGAMGGKGSRGSSNDKPGADIQPPTIVIDAPQYATEAELNGKTTYEDNHGLFKVRTEIGHQYSETRVLYAGEHRKVVQFSTHLLFGEDTEILAYATDLAGNTTTATTIIYSETAIATGIYRLDTPMDEQISGSGCQLEQFSPLTLDATSISVSGEFIGDNSCDYQDANEDPDAVACVEVSVMWISNPVLGGYTKSAITSTSESSFSKDQLNGSGTGAGGGSYNSYTYMDLEFSDTNPPTVTGDMTLRCESTLYGSEEFGPYSLNGTLQQQ